MKRGFTLIEALIAFGAIALIGVLCAVAVNTARAKQRDAVRLSSVRQVQSALENYFNESSAYPVSETLLPLGDARASACLSTDGFQGDCAGKNNTLLRFIIPTLDKGLSGLSTCGAPARNAFCYVSLQNGADYRIQFELEKAWPGAELVEGLNCATPLGLKSGRCNANP